MADDEVHLAGNVGGAVRVGGTVHRATGPWTPAVHALLDTGAESAAERLRIIAASYGGPDPGQILHAVPQRIRTMLDWIPAAAAAGDAGMAHLMTVGEPGRSAASLAGLLDRIPAIARQLG